MAAVDGWEDQTSATMRGVPAKTASAPLRRASAEGGGSGVGGAAGDEGVGAGANTPGSVHARLLRAVSSRDERHAQPAVRREAGEHDGHERENAG